MLGAKRVRMANLSPTAAYVLWEQTIKAEELNDILERSKVFC